MRTFFLALLFVVFGFSSMAQNSYRFSQYMFNELSVNPAYAGSKNAIMSNMVYRNQWMNIEGQPTTQIVSVQAPVSSKKIGLGALLYNEELGIQNDFGCFLSYAYHIRFPKSYLSFGIQAGLINKNVNWNKIRTASEIEFNETDPVFPQADVNFWMPNMGFGAYYYSDQLYFGLSIPRIFANELPVDNSVADMFSMSGAQIHTYLTAGYVFFLKGGVAFKPSVMIKRVKNAPNQFDFNTNVFLNNGLNFGLGIHLKDSYVFMLGYSLSESLVLSYSFDLTSSDLAFNRPTTHEIVLSYMFHSKSGHILSPRYF
ncbi:MAG: type IX secretion system membrane protein PorP/SprF [Bacteroidales bacterium]|nr:type IX secretion system membrane protein PorP/SprF [Bacteroidales bacterium]MCF8456321.1 type IX secretion system membrane protein PorP/SprF [Bacteroidales bacterium]